MNLVDTSGWLEYLADTPLAQHYAAAIEDPEHLLVPAIVLYEVFKKTAQATDEHRAFQVLALLRQGRVIAVDETVALYAAQWAIEKKLPMADAIIYAIAVLHEATIYTQDAHFQGLPRVKFFPKMPIT